MIILASKSPRRQQLIHLITDDFIVDVSHIDESSSLNMSPIDAVKDIAKRKGLDIAKKHPGLITISADTIVVIDNQIIGKPVDKEDAKRILRLLSNREHIVITAYCLIKNDQFFENTVTSKVLFNNLSEELIDRYVESGIPMDKAGAYGVQDNDIYPIVKSVDGSLHNVIGFPVEEIKQDLVNFEKIS